MASTGEVNPQKEVMPARAPTTAKLEDREKVASASGSGARGEWKEDEEYDRTPPAELQETEEAAEERREIFARNLFYSRVSREIEEKRQREALQQTEYVPRTYVPELGAVHAAVVVGAKAAAPSGSLETEKAEGLRTDEIASAASPPLPKSSSPSAELWEGAADKDMAFLEEQVAAVQNSRQRQNLKGTLLIFYLCLVLALALLRMANDVMYACVNDGCPDKGATVMECKDGYHGPLCAVCNEGSFLQLRACKVCEGSGPSSASTALFIVSLLIIIGLAATVVRHRRFLASTGVFAHVKILVTFTTIMLTVDRQFGVTWPPAFQRALAALSVLSLDIGTLTSLLCIVRLSFYANLLCTTLLLVVLVGAVYLAHTLLQYCHRQAASARPPVQPDTLGNAAEIRQNALFVGVYLLAFAYPTVSIKVVELFGCHNVEGTYYLRADYSLECYTQEWTAMAVYASAFLVAYVFGFPAFVGATLWSYRHALRKQVQGPGQVCKLVPPGLLLGFLLDDYILRLPCYMWETEEMARKLTLSVIGNFWADKSVMSITAALIISLVFQLCHTHYKPFKSPTCNYLQQICMSVLNAVYIAGLLLKTQAAGTTDERDLGVLLVLLLAATILAVGYGVAFEMRFLLHAWTRTTKLTALLRKLPQQDPPDGSSAFYDIQIPVEESNMADAFKPKKPDELNHLSSDSKLAVVRKLSDKNEGLLAAFLDQVSHDPMVPLQQVTTPTLVKSEGRMCVEWGRKTEESIVKKACRPEIRAKNPKFGIEHLRDTFRFRATLFSFRDIVEFILAMHEDPSLSGRSGLTPGNVDKDGDWLIVGQQGAADKGLKAGNVVKLDIKKLVKPKKFGWRFMALDFIMPNHQIVEVRCSFVFAQNALAHSDIRSLTFIPLPL
eukprot:g1179.t1